MIINETGIKQNQLAKDTCISQQAISAMVQKKANVTETTAETIIKKFPQYRIEWLMGYDDYKTEEDRIDTIVSGTHEAYNLIAKLMKLHGYEIVTDTFDYEPPVEENGREYRNLHYGIKSLSSGACAYIGHNEIDRLIDEIDNFIEFKCSSAVNVHNRSERKNHVAKNWKEVDGNG